ncbi:putative transmembrane protein [Helianthus annuus]|nr:putative transmembrane protein [Helianthus annuus]KAJ0707674.1 putative transmembrane protein [Helianthus annuus]
MDANSAELEAILKQIELASSSSSSSNINNDDHGWKTVSYRKSGRKFTNKAPEQYSDHNSGDVFRPIEQMSEDRRRRVVESQKAAFDAIEAAVADDDAAVRDRNDGEDYGGDAVVVAGELNLKKSKPKKKVKKVKVSVAEAAAKVNDSDLAVFLADVTESYESQPDVMLMRFAEYFGRAFASVSGSQFPWMKTLKEATIEKMIDIPLLHISEDVYRTATDWLNLQPIDALGSFTLWCLDSIMADLAHHQGAVKGSKKVVQQPTSKSQVAIFVVLAMVLRRKPDVMIGILPIVKDGSKYQGLEKLPVLVWAITQASQGDLVVGLFMWVRLLLPLVCSKLCNPQSRDLILQLVERILSFPKARAILANGAVRKGERVVPPSALELLMGPTFPAPTARVKATERFEAIYPVLKEVALAVAPGSKAMKQLTQQLLPVAAKAAGKGKKSYDDIYLDHLEASVVILRKLSDQWKIHSDKLSCLDPLKSALKSFRDKNEKAMAGGDEREALLKEADKHCKTILGKFSRGHGCLKATVFLTVTMAVGVAVIIKDHRVWNLKELVDVDLSRAFSSLSH